MIFSQFQVATFTLPILASCIQSLDLISKMPRIEFGHRMASITAFPKRVLKLFAYFQSLIDAQDLCRKGHPKSLVQNSFEIS